MNKGEKSFVPVVKHLKHKTAVNKKELFRLLDQFWEGAIDFDGIALPLDAQSLPDGRKVVRLDTLKRDLSYWCDIWSRNRRKTEVFYLLIPFHLEISFEDLRCVMDEFEYRAFSEAGLFGVRDMIYAVKPQQIGYDVHMLVRREGFGQELMSFNYKTQRSYQGLRNVLADSLKEIGIETTLYSSGDKFTMSYHEAIQKGINLNDYTEVETLPSGIKIKAVAGVWGNKCNLRLLFKAENGDQISRNLFWNKRQEDSYFVSELGRSGKEIEIGGIYHTKNADLDSR